MTVPRSRLDALLRPDEVGAGECSTERSQQHENAHESGVPHVSPPFLESPLMGRAQDLNVDAQGPARGRYGANCPVARWTIDGAASLRQQSAA